MIPNAKMEAPRLNIDGDEMAESGQADKYYVNKMIR